MHKPSSSIAELLEEQAQNQEAVISENEHSPEFQPSRKRLNIEDEDPQVLSESSDGVQVNLTRSDASVGRVGWNRDGFLRYPNGLRYPAKQPMQPEPMDEDSDDDEDKDLAWFFKRHHPDIDKHRQIAWCRTFANCLAAQIPKNRPKTYKKKAKTNEN